MSISTGSRVRTVRSSAALAAAVVAAAALLGACGDAADADRRVEVARRGATVMPFDLDVTTHRFSPRDTGGLQTVVADRAGDREQVAAIRRHLRAEAEAFARGDFTDPTSIHGREMPGLATLQGKASALAVRYADRPEGAQIEYSSTDPEVVRALHDWFDAQVSDHGGHAEHGG